MFGRIICQPASSWFRVGVQGSFVQIRSSLSHSYSVVDNQTEQHQIPLSAIFTEYGFPPSDYRSILKSNPILQTFDSSDLEKSFSIISSFDLSRNSLISLIRRCPAVLNFDFLKEFKAILSENASMDIIRGKIHIILECSSKFDLRPLDVAKSIRCLKRHNLKDDTVAMIFEVFPTVTLLDDEEIEKRVKFLTEIGIPAPDIDHVYRKFPTLLCFDVETRLKPLFDELVLFGIHEKSVIDEIIREPSILSMELGQMSRYSELQAKLKCRQLLKNKILKKGIIRVGFELKLRIDCLCSHGLSPMEAMIVLRKEPTAIISPLVEIKKKIQFLIVEMKHDISWIIDVPKYLGVDFKNHLLPRYKIARFLMSNGYIVQDISLKCIITVNRLKFYNMYVKPYPECQQIWNTQ